MSIASTAFSVFGLAAIWFCVGYVYAKSSSVRRMMLLVSEVNRGITDTSTPEDCVVAVAKLEIANEFIKADRPPFL